MVMSSTMKMMMGWGAMANISFRVFIWVWLEFVWIIAIDGWAVDDAQDHAGHAGDAYDDAQQAVDGGGVFAVVVADVECIFHVIGFR